MNRPARPCLLLIILMVFTDTALANETVPIPPQRPRVMHASPAYIEELYKRQSAGMPLTRNDLDSIAPTDEDALDNLEPGTTEDILKVIDPSYIPPSPPQKPARMETKFSFKIPPEIIDLSEDIRKSLKNDILIRLLHNETLILEIYAFATPLAQQEDSQTRISLARTLEVRKYLIEQGAPPERIKLRPMTSTDKNRNNVQADDRIDILLVPL